MDIEDTFREISRIKQIPLETKEQRENFINNLSETSNFFLWCVYSGVTITKPEELIHLENNLSENYSLVAPQFIKMDYFGHQILDSISEDAYSWSFNEKLIREALYRGFYPMSVYIDSINILSIRYHKEKCIITPDTFRFPHNIKKLIEKKFSNCTLTFNSAFEKCIDEIKTAYPETWLCPELIKVFTNIHNNPDSNISIDSIEIWQDGKLIAGEIGFITGNSYASLSGFHKVNNAGTVQMALLGHFLFENGFAYWDLGMSIPYKYRYGAFDADRTEQESRWKLLNSNRNELSDKTEYKLSDFLKFDFFSTPEKIDPNRIIPFPEPNTKYSFLSRQICEITDSIPIQLLYSAYMQGVFPWFSEEDKEPVIWYSNDPRFVLIPEDFHCPKSLKKFMKKSPYTYTMDKCFRKVMLKCAEMKREDQKGTWIGPMMIDAYTKFHKAGYAHSFEVWDQGKLIGGFYGVLIGSIFFGESMFTEKPNSSKSAFAYFMKAFIECSGILVDSQSYTENIARYGAKNISREAFLRIEQDALYTPLKKDLKTIFQNITTKE